MWVELQKLFVRVWDVFLRCFRACRLPSHFSNRKFDTLWNFQSVTSSARCAVNRCSKLDQIGKLEMRQTQSRQCPFDLDFVHRKGPKERIRPQLQLPEVTRNWLGRNSEILWDFTSARDAFMRRGSSLLKTTYLTNWTCKSMTLSDWCAVNRFGGHNHSNVVGIDFVRAEGSIERIWPWLQKLLAKDTGHIGGKLANFLGFDHFRWIRSGGFNKCIFKKTLKLFGSGI